MNEEIPCEMEEVFAYDREQVSLDHVQIRHSEFGRKEVNNVIQLGACGRDTQSGRGLLL